MATPATPTIMVHKREEAPAQARGALASTVSLEALSASLNSVDTSAYGGRSGLPMMLFKREGSGTYVVGSRRWESLGYQPDDFLLGLRRLQQGQQGARAPCVR